jgi:hypothetical protein
MESITPVNESLKMESLKMESLKVKSLKVLGN